MPALTLQTRPTSKVGKGARLADEADDKILLSQFASGDEAAFDRLVRRHQESVVRLTHRLLGWQGAADVDDVVQEVFLVALRRLKSFRGESSISTWLMGITINQCRNHRRRSIARLRWLKSFWNGNGAIHRTELRDETSQQVRDAVAHLPVRDREVIVLYYLEQLPVCEISRLLGVKSNAIDVRLHRARARLREELKSLIED